MFKLEANVSHAPRLKIFPSGNKEGVPSLDIPNGSNASNPGIPPFPPTPPNPFPPPPAPPGPKKSLELDPGTVLRLREGLNERVSKVESGNANDRSGGGLGAGGAKEEEGAAADEEAKSAENAIARPLFELEEEEG